MWLGLEDERESEERGGESSAPGRAEGATQAPRQHRQTDNRMSPSTVLQVLPSTGLEGTGTASAGVQSQSQCIITESESIRVTTNNKQLD